MPTKLIIVSNREPYFIKRGLEGEVVTQPNAGGLTAALDPLAARAGATWISWSGVERELPREGEPLPERVHVPGDGEARYVLRRIPLSEREASLYYYGFASRTLWPLAHQFLGKVEFDAEAWRAYRRVNQRFAEAVLEEIGAEPAHVWVHDHHLCLVPALLRAARPTLRIGFSWHLPWPPVDVFRALPWARDLIDGILGADAVGMSFDRDARYFADAVREVADGEVAGERVRALGREATLHIQPMGPDVAAQAAWARQARGGRVVRLRRALGAERLLLAVDPLDFTKGVLERLDAVAHFFDRYPSYRGRAVFCQIAIPSRTRVESYREMKRVVDERVARINERFQTPSWQPVRYLYRNLEPAELAVYYCAAEVALVTPLRDGTAQTALEYVASRIHDDGVLVLSELTGAADMLREAVRVNPNSPDEVASALRAALDMPADEAHRRMRLLREHVAQIEVGKWRRDFTARAFGEEIEVEAPAASPGNGAAATM